MKKGAKGEKTGKEIKMLFVLAKKRESTIIFRLIKDIDPNAFVVMNSINDTKGGMIKKRALNH